MDSKLYLPGKISTEPWMGGLLHKLVLEGCMAWIVEPPCPSPRKYWFWVPEWPDAFPERNGVKELLQMGFYMVYINVFGKFANEEALQKMHAFYEYIVSLEFFHKGAFIGMSMGGLYSFRFVQKYPETATCIYADAPVCDLAWRADAEREDVYEVSEAYGYGRDSKALENNPYSPINAFQNIVKAQIPLLLILGLDDIVVPPKKNGLLLAERWEETGGNVEVISRSCWGHHPHGLDQTGKIVRFIVENTMIHA